MTETVVETLAENDLDTLVSIAIRRAEILEDIGSGSAEEAWLEVLAYEERLAAMTSGADIAGGIARAGAVHAALAAGRRDHAERLAREYLEDHPCPLNGERPSNTRLKKPTNGLPPSSPHLRKAGG